MHSTKITILAAGLMLAGCTDQWQAKERRDEFTGAEACAVELGGYGGYGYVFLWPYAERRGDEVRAGVRNVPAVPIAGDVQLKVGEKLYTMTSNDAPLDVVPSMPDMTPAIEQAGGKNYAASVNGMMQNIQKMGSPYRAYVGPKAIALLRDMAQTNEPIKLRTVGVNSQLSMTGEFKTGPAFTAALQKCGIVL